MPSPKTWAALVCAALCAPSTAAADPLLYAGQLTGDALGDIDDPTIAFALFAVESGGDPVWQGQRQPLALDADGRFTAWLEDGELAPLSPAHVAQARWLEVQIDGHPLEPRQPIGAVPRALSAGLVDAPRGVSRERPATSCSDALESGVDRSGVVWVVPPLPDRAPPLEGAGEPREIYCDQVTQGGGWALIYNSMLGVDTTWFWRIPHEERLGRFGHPTLTSNFYDGLLYLAGHGGNGEPREYLDVVEDLRGQSAIAVHAEAHAFHDERMAFERPRLLDGNEAWFNVHVAAGWSAAGWDGDQERGANCAERYQGVTQHYRDCWIMNLGADAGADTDEAYADGRVGPHIHRAIAQALGLAADGSHYTRVRRISRFVRW